MPRTSFACWSTLAFGVSLKPAQVHTEGITRITQADIAYARELGYVDQAARDRQR